MVCSTSATSAFAQEGTAMFSLDSTKHDCTALSQLKIGPGEFDVRECGVTRFGVIGKVETATYYFALYCLLPNFASASDMCISNRYSNRAVVVFVQEDSSTLASKLYEFADYCDGMVSFDAPRLVQIVYGLMIYIPA